MSTVTLLKLYVQHILMMKMALKVQSQNQMNNKINPQLKKILFNPNKLHQKFRIFLHKLKKLYKFHNTKEINHLGLI